jgi:hypothetical protein
MYNAKGETKWETSPKRAVQRTARTTKTGTKGTKGTKRITKGNTAIGVNPKHAKYHRMLKAGVPLPAVQGKMRQEGLNDQDIAAVCGGASGGGGSIPTRTSQGVRLSRLAQPGTMKKLDKYNKMKKARIPKPAILRTMLNDGIDEKLAHAFLGTNGGGGGSGGVGGGQKSNGMMKLHWKKLDQQQLSENSIWSPTSTIKLIGMDEVEKQSLKFMFSATKSKILGNKKNRGGGGGGGGAKKPNKKILDGKRSQNVEICLQKFRGFDSYEEVGLALSSMDTARLR